MKKTITFLSKRAAMMLLATMLLTLTAQTAWADNIDVATAAGFGTLTDGKYTLVNGNTYTLTDDVNTEGYIYVPADVTARINLQGHTIDRELMSAVENGMVIKVAGTLTIDDFGTGGKIQGGYDAGEGYGYYTSCVKVLEDATFNLQGGTLIGRVQDYDYTVSVVDNSNFTMTGGKITGGWTGVLADGNVTLTGGEISGNNIGVSVGENFSISGNPVITENTEMNVNLRSSWWIRKINITGALTDGANIGITVRTPTDNSPVTVTSGYGIYNSEPVSTYFSLDNDGQIQTSPFDYMTVVMGWNEDRTEVAVGTALYTVNFDMNGHGDAIDDVSLLSGYKVAEPTEPTANEWFFVDWFTDDACTTGNEYDFDNAVTSNMTLHARWTQEAIYSIILPEKMVIVSTTNAPVGGKYPVGTVIKFKVSSADYVVDGDVSDGTNTLTPDGNGIYTVTMGNADITITATLKKAVEPNKTLSGDENYTANDGDVLTGSTSGTVTIVNNAKITLSDVTITGGIVCEGTAEITLVGTNSVTGASLKAGIQVGGSGTTFTIKGNGSLTANGGNQSAGIGLSRAWNVDATGGDIVIEGGTITANGSVNGQWGAGIGTGVIYGGKTARLGNITIKGGTVTANGGSEANGIGTGYCYNGNTNEIGTVTITTGIDRVEASSISGTVVYKHEDNDVTTNASDYFTIAEDGSKRTITLREYTITYNLNGGTNATGNPATYNLKTETFTIADPSKDGYTFAGWFSDAEFNTPATTTITKGTTGEKTFWAKWSENIATLTEADPIAPLTAWSGQQTKVNFTRSGLTAGAYSTICLPYNFTASETCTFYKFDGVKKVGDNWVADISTTTGGTANTPYIFTTDATSVTFSNDAVNAAASYSDTDAKTTITDWTFQGTYSQIALPKDGEYDYGFAAGSNSNVQIGSFVHLKSGASAAPFRAYLKYTGSDDNWAKAPNRAGAANDAMPSRIIVRIVGADGGTTAIGTLDTRTGEISTGEWFDLNGRRLQGKPTTKGIYIHNGRKEVLK